MKREDVFVTSKLWNTDHSYEKASEAIDKILKDLQLPYLDLMLIHWPMGYKEDDGPFPQVTMGKCSSQVFADFAFFSRILTAKPYTRTSTTWTRGKRWKNRSDQAKSAASVCRTSVSSRRRGSCSMRQSSRPFCRYASFILGHGSWPAWVLISGRDASVFGAKRLAAMVQTAQNRRNGF